MLFYFACEAAGAPGARHSLRPLWAKVQIKTRAHAARTRSCVWNLSSSCCEWSEAMDGCASVGSKLDCFATLAMTGPLDREWSEAMDGSATRFEAGLLRYARNDGAA